MSMGILAIECGGDALSLALSTPTGKRKDGSIRRGLALLIPMRQNTDERRQPRPGAALDSGEATVDSAVAQ